MLKKINPNWLKFGGFAIVIATAFFCPNVEKVAILVGTGAIAAGVYWPKLG